MPPSAQDLAQEFVDYLTAPPGYQGHDAAILRACKIISASYTPTPCVTTRIKITPSLCNSLGNLHGGAAATILDDFTTVPVALVRKTGFWEWMGVSRTLSVTLLNAVAEGEEVEVLAELVSIGKRMAHIRGTMTRVRDGAVVAIAEHDKVDAGPQMSKL